MALVALAPACGRSSVGAAPDRVADVQDAVILLRDEFNAQSLDLGEWFIPTGEGSFLGRTQIRPPSEPPLLAYGRLTLRLDTFNPTARVAGDSFWGSEIATHRVFDRGAGLSIRARVRVTPPVSPGLVASVFSYSTRAGVRDEIDFEILTNDVALGRPRILTNLFDNDPFSVAGGVQFATVGGVQWTDFNELEIQWLPDRVRWLVNGAIVRDDTAKIPDEPMSVRLNVWAPGSDFGDAFDARVRPATSARDNQSFFYDVDFVEISRRQPE